MANSQLVVDGSNIATEGRTAPSLAQLDEAVSDFLKEHHFDNVVVVVDATFAHRIDQSEREAYEEAVLAGELLTPPAGAVGRGDAFVLQIAERSGATILSNDSFQEFHATYEWLFADGRLWGGKPVPGVGWVFVARVPVRGPVSRRAVRDAKKDPVGGKAAGSRRGGRGTSSKSTSSKGTSAKDDVSTRATSTDEPSSGRRRGRKKSGGETPAASVSTTPATTPAAAPRTQPSKKQSAKKQSSEPINTPGDFLGFVTSHQLGSTIEATVVEFSSHGAYVDCDGARCYVSLKSMGEPAPRSAREVLAMGEVRPFVVQGFDTPRRGIDLALPGFEQVEADSSTSATDSSAPAGELHDGDDTTQPDSKESAEEETVAATKKAPAKKAPAKKAPAKKAPAKKAPAKKAPAKKAPAKKAPAKKAPAKKAPAKKAPAKKAPAKKAPAKKAPAKKAPAKKAPARKAPAKKAPAKKAPAKKAPAKKAPAKKAPAKKAPARKAPARKAPAKKS